MYEVKKKKAIVLEKNANNKITPLLNKQPYLLGKISPTCALSYIYPARNVLFLTRSMQKD